jgi:hypothetical protein
MFCIFLFTSAFGQLQDGAIEGASVKPEDVILFMFFGLGLGILVTQILSLFGERIPYACIIFILGIIFSTINKTQGFINYFIWM